MFFLKTDAHTKKALNLFKGGFNCSQAVLAAFAADFGLDENTALKIAAGLGGGMGCTAKTCGAVSGAILVLGLKYGSAKANDKESKATSYAKVREFLAEFEKRHGSVECRGLLGVDISTEAGFAEARDKKIFKSICPKAVEDAADILSKMIKNA